MNPDIPVSRMADILLPAPPPDSPLLLPVLSGLGIIALLGIVYLWWQRRRAGQPVNMPPALQQFELVRQQQLGCRKTAYRLATVLRRGFYLPQLTMTPPAATINLQQWQQTVDELNRLRYTPTSSHTISDKLFDNIKQLLIQAQQD